jgi:hypothetical protein
VDGRAILQWDIFASNGVIHVISSPLKAPLTPEVSIQASGLGPGRVQCALPQPITRNPDPSSLLERWSRECFPPPRQLAWFIPSLLPLAVLLLGERGRRSQ